MLTNDYQGMPGRPDVYSEFRSALAVPMHRDGRLHGVLSLGWTRPHLLTRDHLGLLSAFGELAAAACRNASAHEGLALAARTDGLTGCLNHAALHETLGRELERCRRTGQPLSLALVDLDDFKQVNELHGHLVGDEVLRRVGQSLRQTLRAYDVVGRYGGDEFAIVAVDTTEADAAEVAARAIHRCGAGATAGVAEWRPDESATELIARADGALLFGKQNGRKGEAFAASAVPQDAPQPALSESR
jgi:diguanylate cyclase (GGDEF)-like protein